MNVWVFLLVYIIPIAICLFVREEWKVNPPSLEWINSEKSQKRFEKFNAKHPDKKVDKSIFFYFVSIVQTPAFFVLAIIPTFNVITAYLMISLWIKGRRKS